MASGVELSFRSTARPMKTEAARLMLRGGSFSGTRPQRLLLIMVDGRKTLLELGATAAALGLSEPDLKALAHGGWITFAESPLERSPERSPEPLAAATPSAVVPALAPVVVAPAAAPAPIRSLAAAKMYALSQIGVMLPGRDDVLSRQARFVRNEAELASWLRRVATEVAKACGETRSARFLERVEALLPEAAAVNMTPASIAGPGLARPLPEAG